MKTDMAWILQHDSKHRQTKLIGSSEYFTKNMQEKVPQDLKRIFDTSIDTHRKRSTAATRQWFNTWTPIVMEALKATGDPEGDPTNLENYPYSTALETG